jgi:eukaryotic-like serine/threonine-protein kinase
MAGTCPERYLLMVPFRAPPIALPSEFPAALAAAFADRYRLERELGAGGMATVYLAKDLRHNRRVAVKVLRPELAAAIGAKRFLAEITTTANLQHPHILPLFDSGEAGGFLFYVMPLVEGETVRDRLDREEQLPIADAVRIASDVAAALDYAHRHGIIHRDIKPANILLHEGSAMVADFGIALAASRAGGTRITETGLSLGTPHYMSPEQVMGDREITARSDVYALGAVTYEMLTGEPPFTGTTAQAIVARLMTGSPRAMGLQRHTIPPHVEAAVLTALERLPADRFASAAEFAAALADRGFAQKTPGPVMGMGAGAPPARAPNVRWLLPVLAAAALLLAVAAAWGWLRPGQPRPVTRYSMGLPPGQSMRPGETFVNLDVSSDGRRMVYVGEGQGGDQLWLRERDQLEGVPLPGTLGAVNPFFSPDGERVAFFVPELDFELKVVPAGGGTPITLATPGPGAGGGGAWGHDGWIYFDTPNGLARVRADGGNTELLIPLDSAGGESGHAWPEALPGGKGIIFRSRRALDESSFDLVAMDLETRTRHVLTKGVIARYVEPGYLVFVRAGGMVLAAPFDERRLELTGPPVALFDGVRTKGFGATDFAISENGTLAYVQAVRAGGNAELVYVDRTGAATPLDPPLIFNPPANRGVSLSPDGRRAALDVLGPRGTDIWVRQLPAGAFSRLTFDEPYVSRPTWTADGRSVVYISPTHPDTGATLVRRRRADGAGPAETILPDLRARVTEATQSRDGEWLVYRVTEPDGNRDIHAVRPGRDSAATPLLTGHYAEQAAQLSPDGRWLAYMSDEAGTTEIFVRPFPAVNSGRWQVSTAGGIAPRWSHSGRELFFESAAGDLMVVPIAPGETFSPGQSRRLFTIGGAYFNSIVVPYYDLTPDDQRFLMARPLVGQAPGAGQVVVVDNWIAELRAAMEREDR